MSDTDKGQEKIDGNWEPAVKEGFDPVEAMIYEPDPEIVRPGSGIIAKSQKLTKLYIDAVVAGKAPDWEKLQEMKANGKPITAKTILQEYVESIGRPELLNGH